MEQTAASQSVRREVERIWTELADRLCAELTPAEQAEALRVLHRNEDGLCRSASPPTS